MKGSGEGGAGKVEAHLETTCFPPHSRDASTRRLRQELEGGLFALPGKCIAFPALKQAGPPGEEELVLSLKRSNPAGLAATSRG